MYANIDPKVTEYNSNHTNCTEEQYLPFMETPIQRSLNIIAIMPSASWKNIYHVLKCLFRDQWVW